MENLNIRVDGDLKKQADPFYSQENQHHLKKAIADLDSGKGHTHELIEIDDE